MKRSYFYPKGARGWPWMEYKSGIVSASHVCPFSLNVFSSRRTWTIVNDPRVSLSVYTRFERILIKTKHIFFLKRSSINGRRPRRVSSYSGRNTKKRFTDVSKPSFAFFNIFFFEKKLFPQVWGKTKSILIVNFLNCLLLLKALHSGRECYLN